MKDKSLRLWDTETGTSQLLLTHPNYITVLAAASQASTFAAATDTGQVLCGRRPPRPLARWRLGTASVSVLAFSPDGS